MIEQWLAPLVALASVLIGAGLLVAGVYDQFGRGWALMAGSVPFLVLAFIVIRGIARA